MEPVPPEDVSENDQLLDWLYDAFLANAENSLEFVRTFNRKINRIFEEYGSNTRIEIYDEDNLPPEAEEEGVQHELITDENEIISNELIIALTNFLFNLPEGTAPILQEEGSLEFKVRNFNDFAKEIGSNIRIIPYPDQYEAVELRKTSRKLI